MELIGISPYDKERRNRSTTDRLESIHALGCQCFGVQPQQGELCGGLGEVIKATCLSRSSSSCFRLVRLSTPCLQVCVTAYKDTGASSEGDDSATACCDYWSDRSDVDPRGIKREDNEKYDSVSSVVMSAYTPSLTIIRMHPFSCSLLNGSIRVLDGLTDFEDHITKKR